MKSRKNQMKHKLTLILLWVAFAAVAQNNKATFPYFEYTGSDACFEQKIDPETQFRNPILPGMYPDPSICRRGDDYFLINSTFSYFPGIPIFHSKDLVNWKQIGHVLDRPSQLKLDGLGLSGGVYAPAIEYNEENQTFFVINTVVGGIGNFIVKTKDPSEGWSDPVKLPEVKGIDPSLFFDDDGKGYIVNSSASEIPKWSGHSVIWMHGFDPENDKASAERFVVVDGGPDTTKHPRWLEGPHIYKVKGMYYLMAAEGGTQSGHKEVIFRSEKVKGPYLPYKNNPILTQLGLPVDRKNKVTNVGHADLIKSQDGDWYAVFLGCRPYADEQFNTGRETFLLPVKWEDGFPLILENGKEVPLVVTKKGLQPQDQKLTGNFTWLDDFDDSKLDMRWIMLRTLHETWWKINDGKIELQALPRSLSQLVNPAFIACRQQHLNFDASTAITFTPETDRDLAGLAYFQNDKNYFVIGKTLKNGKMVVVLHSVTDGMAMVISEEELSGKLLKNDLVVGVSVKEGTASFHYAGKGGKRILLAGNVDVSNLSTKNAKGFVGCVVGMYATSVGW
jgi:xylan 1,4-beta-xylosidase